MGSLVIGISFDALGFKNGVAIAHIEQRGRRYRDD